MRLEALFNQASIQVSLHSLSPFSTGNAGICVWMCVILCWDGIQSLSLDTEAVIVLSTKL